MSRVGLVGDSLDIGFPRVSGDEPSSAYSPRMERMFSPRERG